MAHRTTTRLLTAAGTAGLLAACSVVGQDADQEPGRELTVVTHDSFALDEDLLADFEAEHGYRITQVAPGDAGALVNQLVLTQDSPMGDVVYGIDNAFASRAVAEGVLEPYPEAPLPEGADRYAVDEAGSLTPVDMGDVCVNVDHQWFTDQGLAEPTTLADLTEHADRLVVTNPATSSPGLAFLLATVAEFGPEGWQQYWQQLAEGGVSVVDGWSDAYYVDFTATEDGGTRPLVVSYSSSPAAEVDGGEPRTGALLETCFRQVEYAGVLAGADNPDGARAFVDFLLSPEVQADIPTSMYMYPVDPTVELPEAWAEHAPLSDDPYTVPPQDITDHREEWVRTWTEVVVG